MTTDLQELGERVAKVLGYELDEDFDGEWCDQLGNPVEIPSDPAECFKLCAEFNVWPVACELETGGTTRYWVSCNYDYGTGFAIDHDNTTTGRLNAAIEAVLLAVLAIKEQS